MIWHQNLHAGYSYCGMSAKWLLAASYSKIFAMTNSGGCTNTIGNNKHIFPRGQEKGGKEMMPIHSSEIQGTDDLEPLSGSPNPLYGDVVCFAIKRAACR